MKKILPQPKPKRIKKAKRLKRQHKIPMKRLEALTWIIFSKYIRLRDAKKAGSLSLDWCKCYTCNKDMKIEDAETRHFIPRGKHSTKFLEINVHSQCTRCNRFLHGNLAKYTLQLIKDYGKEAVSQLMMMEQVPHKFKRKELENIRRKCALKISKLLK